MTILTTRFHQVQPFWFGCVAGWRRAATRAGAASWRPARPTGSPATYWSASTASTSRPGSTPTATCSPCRPRLVAWGIIATGFGISTRKGGEKRQLSDWRKDGWIKAATIFVIMRKMNSRHVCTIFLCEIDAFNSWYYILLRAFWSGIIVTLKANLFLTYLIDIINQWWWKLNILCTNPKNTINVNNR